MKAAKKDTETRLRVINSKTHRVSFVLEPWGDVYDMEPADEYVVIFTGPVPAEPEVDLMDDSITVYGWTGSMVRVIKDGKEVVNYEGLKVPATP